MESVTQTDPTPVTTHVINPEAMEGKLRLFARNETF